MAPISLYDALLGNTKSESDYLANDPYFVAGAGVSKWDMPKPQNDMEALLGPAFQGLLSGALLGYGKQSAHDTMYQDYLQNPLVSALQGRDQIGAPFGPLTQSDATAVGNIAAHNYQDLSAPQQFDPETMKSRLAQLVIDQATQQTNADKMGQIQAELVKGLSLKGMTIDPATGAAKPIPGYADTQAQITLADETAKAEAKNTIEKSDKDKATTVNASAASQELDRLLNMADKLPDTMVGRTLQGVSPFTNKTNFFDDQTAVAAAALAKLREGRVNETVLHTYQESLARHEGDTKADIKSRLVNVQTWLQTILNGNVQAENMNAAEFAKARGVDPGTIGISDIGPGLPINATDTGQMVNGKKIYNVGGKLQVME